MSNYLRDHTNPNKTPQSEPIPGTEPNSAGGYSFVVDDWERLRRFLILGAEGGSYYASERKLTRESAACVERCLKVDGARTVQIIVEISEAGRAPNNDPAIMALAMAAKLGDGPTRKLANAAVPRVCRIGTHILHFAEFVQNFGGWSRGVRGSVSRWFEQKSAEVIAYQAVKYRQRDGWSQRDLLRVAHPKAPTQEHAAIFNWITKGKRDDLYRFPGGVLIDAFENLQKETNPFAAVRLITEHRLPRECVPTELLNHASVWEALLPQMGLEAMVRNLAKMTSVGLVAPLSRATSLICDRLADGEAIEKARLHPIKVLAALLTYQRGRGVKGSLEWKPVSTITNALDAAFYLAFRAVEPTRKRTLLALDISGSMDWSECCGVPGLTPRVGSAAMSLVTAATEKDHHFIAFSSGGGFIETGIRSIDISPSQRLDAVCERLTALPHGGTDCALPMIWAGRQKVPVDTFVVYTDSETWHGKIHPVQALREYRQQTGIPAKLIVVGMVANQFTIADSKDGGMLDVVGFDTAAPSVMADFAR